MTGQIDRCRYLFKDGAQCEGEVGHSRAHYKSDLNAIRDAYCGPNRTNLPIVDFLCTWIERLRIERDAAIFGGPGLTR